MGNSIIERFGEKTLRLLERLYLLVIDGLIKVAPFFKGMFKRVQDFDSHRLYPMFQKRDIEMRDYTVFKLQMSSALFLVTSTLFIIGSIGLKTFFIFAGISGALSMYFLYFPLRRDFDEFKAYRDTFIAYHILLVLLAVLKVIKPAINYRLPYLHFAALAVVGAFAIYVYFTKNFSRDYTYGIVLSSHGSEVTVKVNYDITSNVKPQTLYLRNTMNAREGDKVKLRVKSGFLSLRGSRPLEIIGVEWG